MSKKLTHNDAVLLLKAAEELIEHLETEAAKLQGAIVGWRHTDELNTAKIKKLAVAITDWHCAVVDSTYDVSRDDPLVQSCEARLHEIAKA